MNGITNTRCLLCTLKIVTPSVYYISQCTPVWVIDIITCSTSSCNKVYTPEPNNKHQMSLMCSDRCYTSGLIYIIHNVILSGLLVKVTKFELYHVF